MGYCKLCHQHQESPDDCDCDRGDDRCTACGAHLDQHGHFEGCGNAGQYDDEPPTVPQTLDQFLLDCVTDCVEGRL